MATAQQQRTSGNGSIAERTADEATKIALEKLLRPVEWKAADTGESLSISIALARTLFAIPTRNGHLPSDREVFLFLQMCKARGLNPYVGDAILTGYDTNDGPKFSLITTVQALFKRAEASGKKTGMESGVIVLNKKSHEVEELRGDFYLDDTHKLVGGWCKVYRNDYDMPVYERVKLSVYDKGRSRWKDDPGGMITKCAEAAAHRSAFPAETGGLYVREEMDGETVSDERPRPNVKRLQRSSLSAAEETPPELVEHADDESQVEPDDKPHVRPSRESVKEKAAKKSREEMSEAELFELDNPVE